MAIEKRVPMAGNMEKVASEDFVSKAAMKTVEGDNWSIELPESIVDTIDDEVIRQLVNSAYTTLTALVKMKNGEEGQKQD